MSLCDSRSLSVLPLVAVLAACASKDASKNASAADTTKAVAAVPHQMTVVAADYNFTAPDEVPAGLMTVHLVDNGSEMHHVAFVKLNDGKTMADVAQALKAQGPPPAWMVDHGGSESAAPRGRNGVGDADARAGKLRAPLFHSLGRWCAALREGNGSPAHGHCEQRP